MGTQGLPIRREGAAGHSGGEVLGKPLPQGTGEEKESTCPGSILGLLLVAV